jgi:hypothetical protein
MAENESQSEGHRPMTIEITINGTPYIATGREMTGAQLKALGHVPASETLFLSRGEGQEERIEDTDTVKLRNHMAFESGPDGSVS